MGPVRQQEIYGMAKITFMGAGSTVFARNVLGDCMCREALKDSHFALYDIDGERLKESEFILKTLNANINDNRATITTHLGERSRKAALRGADFVVNAIQVGGYEPSTVIDFEIPKKFGLRQTIADTLGIGGIFRALRTIPVMLDFAHDIEEVAPNAWFLNYTNPMAMLTGAMLQATDVKTTENAGGTVEPKTINGLLRHDIYNHKDVEKATASVVFAGEIYIDRCKEAIPDEVLANLPMIVPIREKRS